MTKYERQPQEVAVESPELEGFINWSTQLDKRVIVTLPQRKRSIKLILKANKIKGS